LTLTEAIEFLRPALAAQGQVWADLGAGSGTFTEALAHLLGPSGVVVAVDNDPIAVRSLRNLADRIPTGAASIEVLKGDISVLSAIPDIARHSWQGVLLANVLHFFQEPARLLREVSSTIADTGRVVVIEYRRRSANRWVPYPISPDQLEVAARTAGFESVRMVSERPSRFGGNLYCAVLEG